MIQTFTDNARAAGLTSVIAPVRPTWKERYPLIPIERYVDWRRDDGSHFDPWIRVHERVGGAILAPAPRSMTIRLPVAEWQELTGMDYPDDGEYVFRTGWRLCQCAPASARTSSRTSGCYTALASRPGG